MSSFLLYRLGCLLAEGYSQMARHKPGMAILPRSPPRGALRTSRPIAGRHVASAARLSARAHHTWTPGMRSEQQQELPAARQKENDINTASEGEEFNEGGRECDERSWGCIEQAITDTVLNKVTSLSYERGDNGASSAIGDIYLKIFSLNSCISFLA